MEGSCQEDIAEEIICFMMDKKLEEREERPGSQHPLLGHTPRLLARSDL